MDLVPYIQNSFLRGNFEWLKILKTKSRATTNAGLSVYQLCVGLSKAVISDQNS